MLRVRLRLLLLITAHLTLLCAELSRTEEPSSISGRDKVKPTACGNDCEDRTKVRKRSTSERKGAKCELYYFAPTARDDELFAFWNNTKVEHREAYYKIASFLQTNSRKDEPIFFPAHLPLVEKRDDGFDALVLKDVYVRAKGKCGDIPEVHDPEYYDTNPRWYNDAELREQKEVEMLEDYVERMPRSHWGFRVPKAGEDDVCLDDTGLVVKDFPGIRTCFSMWIYDDKDKKPKHFAGRQIYNRINQAIRRNITAIGFDPSAGDSRVDPIRVESFSLAALFLKEMCFVTNASLENHCAYWTTDHFYVSLCCCYTNRTECAYRNYKFPSQKKLEDTKIRACATGGYYVMKRFGGNHEPKNASDIASSVKVFVQERTSSEFCKWTFTWDSRDETSPEDVLRIDLDAVKRAAITTPMRRCTSDASRARTGCCQRTTTLCPLDPNSNDKSIAVKCVCSDGDLCNKPHSYMDEPYKKRVEMFKKARPCEAQTASEHLLMRPAEHKKPNTTRMNGYMCPVFHNFAHHGRPNTFLQLALANNFWFVNESDLMLLKEHGCHLVEVDIKEVGNCSEKLFEHYDHADIKRLLILLCSVEGNPLGAHRTSYPDAELKKTIARNLTAAKEAFPTCKNGSWSLDFESLSELVVDNSKLQRWLFDNVTDGTNDDITTAHCFVEVTFIYQQQYNFTFGAVSIDDNPLRQACHKSERLERCVWRNSTPDDESQHFACCCARHWSNLTRKCDGIFFDHLKTLLDENVIAKWPEGIMSELEEDPLTKCFEEKTTDEVQAGTDVNRPCARNEGCYTGVHARDVPTTRTHKEHGGCVSEYAPDAKKRYHARSDEAEARFYRICRLPRNQGQCFAVLGTEDSELPDDVKGPQMVCCCEGRVGTAEKCGKSHEFGMKIGDFH